MTYLLLAMHVSLFLTELKKEQNPLRLVTYNFYYLSTVTTVLSFIPRIHVWFITLLCFHFQMHEAMYDDILYQWLISIYLCRRLFVRPCLHFPLAYLVIGSVSK